MDRKLTEDNLPFSLLSSEIAELRETLKDRLDKMGLTLKQAEDGKESLALKIHELEERIKERERLIGARGTEVRELRAKFDALMGEMTQTQSRLQEAEALAARESKQAEDLKVSLNAKILELDERAREKEKVLEARDREVRDLRSRLDLVTNEMAQAGTRLKEAELVAARESKQSEELKVGLSARLGELENQVREKEKLLVIRDAEVKDLKTKTQSLAGKLTRMESLFKEALAFNEGAGEGGGSGPSAERAEERGEEKPAPAKVEPVAPTTEKAALPKESLETVSPLFFDRMVRALTEAMGPMAALVVRDQIIGLGEAFEAFPKKRLEELIEVVSQEISEGAMRTRFRRQMTEEVRREPAGKGVGSEPQPRPRVIVPPAEPGTRDPHQGLASKIQELEGQLKEREQLLKLRETELQNLRSGMATASSRDPSKLGKADSAQTQTTSLIQAKEQEIRKMKDNMSSEMEKLRTELKQKKILLAEMERDEWRARGLRGIWRKTFGS